MCRVVLILLAFAMMQPALVVGQVAERLFVESGKRTAVAHGLVESVKHIAVFETSTAKLCFVVAPAPACAELKPATENAGAF